MKLTLTGRCRSCHEHHLPECMCPPHEVRTTGQTWFHIYVGELEDKVEQLQEACEFAHGALLDAVCTEDGLDGDSGLAVMQMIEDAVPAIKKRMDETTEVREWI